MRMTAPAHATANTGVLDPVASAPPNAETLRRTPFEAGALAEVARLAREFFA